MKRSIFYALFSAFGFLFILASCNKAIEIKPEPQPFTGVLPLYEPMEQDVQVRATDILFLPSFTAPTAKTEVFLVIDPNTLQNIYTGDRVNRTVGVVAQVRPPFFFVVRMLSISHQYG